jgi:hypothetical protein
MLRANALRAAGCWACCGGGTAASGRGGALQQSIAGLFCWMQPLLLRFAIGSSTSFVATAAAIAAAVARSPLGHETLQMIAQRLQHVVWPTAAGA